MKRKASARILAVIFLILGVSGLGAGLRAQEKQEKKEELPHPKTLEELQKAMNSVIEKNHVPGAGVALVSRGEVLWCGGVGKADLQANRGVACDTEFRVGSISKTFVALALLKLQEDGRINLQARLQDVAPEVPLHNPWESTNPVRIANILEHTAGFDDMHFSELYNYKDSADIPILQVLQAHPGPQEVRWLPGTRMSYSNPGYGIAGYLIERVSGQPFDAYIRGNILAPLGFDRGDFQLTGANRALLAQGYQGDSPQPVAYKNIYLRPAGDLKASPGELAKLVQFFLRRGVAGDTSLLRPETIGGMEYPATPLSAKNGLRLGYGLANYAGVEGGVVTHGHDGGIDGFISSYRYMPEQNWGYVVLLNSDNSGKALSSLNQLAIDFLSKDYPKPYQVVATIPPKDLQKFVGYYAARAPRSAFFAFFDDLFGGVRIRLKDGRLSRSGLFGKATPLLPVAKNLFRLENEPEATISFFPNQNGVMCYAALGANGMPYAERSSILWPLARIALLALCALLMASSLVFALLWGLLWLARRMKEVRHLSVRAVSLLAILSLLAALFSFGKAVDQLGVINVWAIAVFLGTILFPVLSLAGLWLAVSVPREEIHGGVRRHSLLVSLACCVVTIFLASWHLLALRLWAP